MPPMEGVHTTRMVIRWQWPSPGRCDMHCAAMTARTFKTRLHTAGSILALAFALLGGCKQGVDGVCQANSDCEDGLVCNRVQGVCQQGGSTTTVDAAPTIDATAPVTVDAAGPDAEPPIDALPEGIDAAPVDAALPPDADLTDASAAVSSDD